MSPPTLASHPSWSQVTLAFALVGFNWSISQVLQLDVGASLVIAAFRCMVQLTVVTFVLPYVFAVEGMWAVARLARRFSNIIIARANGTLTVGSPSTSERTWRI